MAQDLVNDYQSGGTGQHLILGGILLAFSGGVFVMGVRQLTRARQEVTVLKGDLDRVRQEKEQWKQETHQLLEGLSQNRRPIQPMGVDPGGIGSRVSAPQGNQS